MRTIEKQMLKAIQNKINWQLSNTSVFYEDVNSKYGPRSEIYLWGNHIGDFWHQTQTFDVNVRTLIEWPTVTTLSRLRALDVNVYREKNILYLNDKPLVRMN